MSEKPNLYQRILAVTRGAGAVPKAGTFPGQGRWAFHQIDDVVDTLRPLLIEHGVVIVPRILRTESHQADGTFFVAQEIEVRAVNADNPEETLIVTTMGHGVDRSDKAPGKAYSYALKAAYLALFHMRGQPDVESDDIPGSQKSADYTPNFDDPPAGRSERTNGRTQATTGMDLPATENQVRLLERFRDDPRALAVVDGVTIQAQIIALLADNPTRGRASNAIIEVQEQFKAVAA